LSHISDDITIHRDRFGVPHIYAGNDRDASFGIGFCHGQDRSFQLEVLQRLARGTLADLFGSDVIAIDRLSRRIGFARAGTARVGFLTEQQSAFVYGYADGVNAGRRHGAVRHQHEFALLRRRPTPFTAADAMAILSLESFFLASNWDAELARLLVITEDGPEALTAIEPTYPPWHSVSSPPGGSAGVVERLGADIAALGEWLGIEGASNAWAVSADRSATGRPLLANDPHLAPLLPAHWYLCHIVTPHWAVAGASFVGGPTLASGHNGHAAWGVTAGLADNSDLFLEQVQDGTVRDAAGPAAAEVVREVISVRGGDPVIEDVVITKRGPIIGPALEGGVDAISLRATWLQPGPVDGLFSLHLVKSFDDLRRAFAVWPAASFGLIYADADGNIGYSLVGDVPRRSLGDGTVPLPGWLADGFWDDGIVAQADMPHSLNPEGGWVATANNRPAAGIDVDLGRDFIDGYRVGRIVDLLAQRSHWDVSGMLQAQLDQWSGPWAEVGDAIVEALRTDPATAAIADRLAAWDGIVAAGSVDATIFELLWAELDQRAVRAKAPRSAEWALGRGFHVIAPFGILGFRRGSRIAALVRDKPDGWFDDGWDAEIVAAALSAQRRVESLPRPQWGAARPLILRHPLGQRPPLDRVFNLGPIEWGGDGSTVSQAGADPLDPLNPVTLAVASLRTVIDVGDWERCRFVLPGGQSGNPLSPHYADQLPLWRRGDGIPIAWDDAAVAVATRTTLRLSPAIPEAAGSPSTLR
jgi:penicillin amidase